MINKAHISTEAFLPVLTFFFTDIKGCVIICLLDLTHSSEHRHLTLYIGRFCVAMNKTPNRSKRKDTRFISACGLKGLSPSYMV